MEENNPQKKSVSPTNLSEAQFRERVLKIIVGYQKQKAFTERKITDTPTDSLQVVNRKYVTLNGVTGSRPSNPVIGQFYLDTTLGYPIWYNGSNWIDAQGNSV